METNEILGKHGCKIKRLTFSDTDDKSDLHLIAAPHFNKVTNAKGFVLYATKEIRTWDIHSDTPLVNTILFKNADDAFTMGEQILKEARSHNNELQKQN